MTAILIEMGLAKTPTLAETSMPAAARACPVLASTFPSNHNGGQPTSPAGSARDADFGLLPPLHRLATEGAAAIRTSTRRISIPFRQGILRIDPLGSNSANGKYGIPAGNPFVKNARRAGRNLRPWYP